MRLRVITAALFLLGALAVAAPGRAEAKQKLAVLGIEAEDASEATSGTTANLARWLTQGLRARAGKTSGKFEVPASANKDLAEMKLLTDCLDEKPDCMGAMGKDLGVDKMLYGKLTKTKQGWNLSLRLVNVPKAADGKTWDKQFPAGEASEEGMKKIAAAAFADLTGTASAGSIEIQANVDSGTVYIDGSVKGTVSGRAASIADLADGSYTIAVESEGHKRWEKTVTVRAGEPTLVVAELEADTVGDGGDEGGGIVEGGGGGGGRDEGGARPGGTSRALFWTSLVVTAGGVAAFTVTGLKVREYEDQKIQAIVNAGSEFHAGPNDDACALASAQPYDPVRKPCEDGKRMATVTNVLIGVTAVAAVAAGFFYYKGYVAADRGGSRDQAANRKKRRTARALRPGTITVTPQVYTTGAGLGATITF